MNNRFAKIRQSFRTPDGWRLLPYTAGLRGYGQEPGIQVQLPDLPGYVTRDACDKSLADTREADKKSKNTAVAGVAIGAILFGFMFGRMTKKL